MSATLARIAKVSIIVALAAAWGAISDERGDRVGWPTGAPSAHAQDAPPVGVFHGVGVVTAVDRAKGWLTLDHEAITGFMGAMEMMYRVEPPRLTAGLRVGDRVAFDIDAARYAVVAIKLLPRPRSEPAVRVVARPPPSGPFEFRDGGAERSRIDNSCASAQAFLTHSLHQPVGAMSPATDLHAFGATKRLHWSHCCRPSASSDS